VKLLTVIGARPQFVKSAPVSRLLRGHHDELLVHTGQHYDEDMSAAFFRDLEIDEPDVNLGVGGGSHATMTGEMLRRLEPVIAEHEPDGILIYGDTNSTLAAAVVGCKVAYRDGRRPWLAHVEAGLRSFNPAMPEERNRIVADHLSDLLLAPSPAAMDNLAREGLAARAEDVGDVMVDAYGWAAQRSDGHLPAEAAALPGYVLLTLHRPENVDDADRLAGWLGAVAALDRPVIFPVHPRTRAAVAQAGIGLPSSVTAVSPAGYLEMVALERAAVVVLTDSGGVQKEAYLSGVPCLTLRGETEWVETVASGWNRVVADPRDLGAAVVAAAAIDRSRPRAPLYGDGRSAERVVAALERHHAARPSARPVPVAPGVPQTTAS
jgi:UDP-GlcNAc3NAcA epimerase